MESVSPQSSPFLKNLASSSSLTRKEAFISLRRYLRTHGRFTELELLKLWKGLFYCMWMSDRPKTQQELARDLANLISDIREENVLGWLKAFWTTMSREWSGIDALRMNKFLYLIRQYVLATFRYLSRNSWRDDAVVADHLDALSSIPLNPTDESVSNGIRFHVLDVYVDELDKADQDRKGDIPLEALLAPIRNLQEKSPYKFVRKRAEETMADDRLKNWQESTIEETSPISQQARSVLNGTDLMNTETASSDEEWHGIDDS